MDTGSLHGCRKGAGKLLGGSQQALSSTKASPVASELPNPPVWGGREHILGCYRCASPFLHALPGYLLEVGNRALLPSPVPPPVLNWPEYYLFLISFCQSHIVCMCLVSFPHFSIKIKSWRTEPSPSAWTPQHLRDGKPNWNRSRETWADLPSPATAPPFPEQLRSCFLCPVGPCVYICCLRQWKKTKCPRGLGSDAAFVSLLQGTATGAGQWGRRGGPGVNLSEL